QPAAAQVLEHDLKSPSSKRGHDTPAHARARLALRRTIAVRATRRSFRDCARLQDRQSNLGCAGRERGLDQRDQRRTDPRGITKDFSFPEPCSWLGPARSERIAARNFARARRDERLFTTRTISPRGRRFSAYATDAGIVAGR